MSAAAFEAFLARIYVDPVARAHFHADPLGQARKAGLSDEECFSMQTMDWVNLDLAVRGFARKRLLKRKKGYFALGLARLRQLVLAWEDLVLPRFSYRERSLPLPLLDTNGHGNTALPPGKPVSHNK
jgi:hypothetical protein